MHIHFAFLRTGLLRHATENTDGLWDEWYSTVLKYLLGSHDRTDWTLRQKIYPYKHNGELGRLKEPCIRKLARPFKDCYLWKVLETYWNVDKAEL